MNKNVRYVVQAGVIAAIYAVLTIAFAPISYGLFQVRISEALTILPFFTPAAIPGLFIGCIVANFYGGLGALDFIFGSLATLVAALITYYIRRYKYLVPLPAVVVNGVVVGIILNVVCGFPLITSMLWVAFGEAVACYALGLPFLITLEKYGKKFFK